MDECVARVTTRFEEMFGRAPEAVAQAPGRIEVVGNHTDYNGGAVLGAAINRYVWVAAAKSPRAMHRFATDTSAVVVSVAANHAEKLGGEEGWTNYPRGVWQALPKHGLARPTGFDLLVHSNLPAGAGLSSSAALELATALALTRLVADSAIEPAVLAQVGRAAENEFVGVPCGILDQGTVAFGRAAQLVHIDCRVPTFRTVSFPAHCSLWIFNSREKHALIDSLYATRHRECADAARALGVRFLTDLTPERLAPQLTALPEVLARRARHIVEEQARVAAAIAALEQRDDAQVGRLLLASHESSRTLFENSTPALDSLVSLLAQTPGVLGARLTGGGFGGAVMALVNASFTAERAETIAAAQQARGHPRPDALRLEVADGAQLVAIDVARTL